MTMLSASQRNERGARLIIAARHHVDRMEQVERAFVNGLHSKFLHISGFAPTVLQLDKLKELVDKYDATISGST